MLLRALVTFVVLFACGWVTIQSKVRQHVKQVILAHATDKATHFADMVNVIPNLREVISQGVQPNMSEGHFKSMAVSTGLLSMAILDAEGQSRAFINFEHMGHSGHTHHLEPALGGAPAPSGLPWRGQNEMFQVQSHGSEEWHAVVRVPLPQRGDGALGFVLVHLNASKLYLAYSSGLMLKAVLIAGFGLLMFAVPLAAFLVQRRRTDASERDLDYLARFDPLTGALNRAEFLKHAQLQLDAGALGGLAFLDVDKFKLVNDTYGHSVGDAYLKKVTETLREVCGPDSLISRFGGDEFVIGLVACDGECPQRMLEATCAACQQEMQICGLTVSGSVSIGLAKTRDGTRLEDTLHDADTALYFAKSSGKNRVAVFEPEMGAKMDRRRLVEARLREATDDLDFDLHYQPLIRASDRELVGYEALLRLSEEDGTPIPPDEFVPLAEEMGLIVKIGTWVLRSATREIAAQSDNAIVAVNLSPEQFYPGDLPQIVLAALSDAGLSPQRLELELTESLLVDQPGDVRFQIDALQEMGVRMAMDDFGTGFSSLSYLWQFGFDRIKIDKSFVWALEENPERSRDLVDAIVLLGDRLGMDVTAEGVETEEQATLLTALGCDVLQGFHFGRPKPLAASPPGNARLA